MKREIAETVIPSVVERLSELFPGAIVTRIPVEVISLRVAGPEFRESTIIEFGTANEALLVSCLPLEFGDRVRLVSTDGSLDVKASVIAVQFEQERKAVAVRFSENVRNWIIR